MGRTMTNIQDRLLESKMTEIEQVAKAANWASKRKPGAMETIFFR
jgi:hypothetical protein